MRVCMAMKVSLATYVYLHLGFEGVICYVSGSVFRLAFESSQVRYPGSAHSFTSCKLLMKDEQ